MNDLDLFCRYMQNGVIQADIGEIVGGKTALSMANISLTVQFLGKTYLSIYLSI
jgi:hypothetical protein